MSDINNNDIPILTPKKESNEEQETPKKVQEETGVFKESFNFMGDTLGNIANYLEPKKVQEETGVFKESFNFMGDTLGNIANYLEPKRVSPKRTKMMEYSPESVYLADTIKETSEEDEGKDGLFKKLGGLLGLGGAGLAGIGAKLFPQLMSKLPLLALAGGIIWAVIDGIKASLLADEWGVGKVSAAIGGILGGTGEGLKNAFKNMGKWALIGAGIGSVVPVIGTLAGGLIGAAIGFILGWIGGERLSKGIEKVKDKIISFVQEGFVDSIIQFFKDFVNTGIETFLQKIKIKEIWESDQNIVDKIFGSVKNLAFSIIDGLFEGLITATDNLLGEGSVISESLDLIRDFIKPAVDLIISIPKSFIEGIMKAARLKEIWSDEEASFGEKLGMTIANLAEMLIGGIVNMVTTVGPKLINFIKRIFTKNEETGEDALGKRFLDVLGDIGMKMLNFVWDMLQGIYKGIDVATGGKLTQAVEWVDKKLIQPIGEFFQQIPDAITDYKDKVFDWVKNSIVDPIKEFFGLIDEKLAGARLDFAGLAAKIRPGGVNQKEVESAEEEILKLLPEITERQLLQALRGGIKSGEIEKGALGEKMAGAIVNLEQRLSEFTGVGAEDKMRAFFDNLVSTQTQDAIIKPTGEIIRTAPDDTIIASKNPISYNTTNNNIEEGANNRIIEILKNIEKKTGQQSGGSIIQQNFADKYSPGVIMNKLRVSEVM